MKAPAIISMFSFFVLQVQAQKVQTIVPEKIVAGNAFQVQYIISHPSGLMNMATPELENLRLISGPNHYKGTSLINGKLRAIENISFTVLANKEGLVRIKGITVSFKNGDDESTEDIVLNVLPPPKGSFNAVSSYTDSRVYAPASGADLDKLVEENLFVKAEVSKRGCFLGEAITATFKLYSRLQSSSEVLNAPSLYGFSVMDIFNVNELHQAVENINGKIFNTSVLRKLQLYPAQTGKLVVDPMQIQNEIEFEDSITGEKIKVQKLLASKPIEIAVKALPGKQPADFSGAVGKFVMGVTLEKARMTAGEKARLIVKIAGQGNFIQLAPPEIKWPAGLDVFDALVSDNIDKTIVPAEGTREYSFLFTTDRPGNYTIPPISFSFFDPQSGSFKKVNSEAVKIEMTQPIQEQKKIAAENKAGTPKSRLWFFSALLGVLLVVYFFVWKKRQLIEIRMEEAAPSYHQKLQVIVSSQLGDKEFCLQLQKLFSELDKTSVLSADQKAELQSLKSDCRLIIYSGVVAEGGREALEKRAENLFQQLS